MKTRTADALAPVTPNEALRLLKEGNARFLNNAKMDRDLLEQVRSTADGQFPFAVILSCIDSRTSAELIFDQGLGDIFSIRIAGNVLNDDILGSMEFACKLAGSVLIVVLGHSACGAVKGACDEVTLGALTGLLQKIRPSINLVKRDGSLQRDEFVQRVAEQNVDLVVREILDSSETLDAMISDGKVGIVGAMYSVRSGEIEFQDMICG